MTVQTAATEQQLRHPRLQRLLAYWHDKRGSRPLPSRADIDPLEFPWILGDLSLVEVHRSGGAPLRYRFRLVGSRVRERFGYDLTGTWLSEMPGTDYRLRLHKTFAEVVEKAVPMSEQLHMLIDDQLHDYEVLRLPLGEGERVDMLMIAVDFNDRHG